MTAIAGVALAAVLAWPGPAVAASTDEARLVSLSNALRASVGAPALILDESLSNVARAWAASMAATGTISHNPNLGTLVRGWTKIAENVGMGPSVDAVHRALVASRPHYVNLTDPELTVVGIGVAPNGGTVFVVEVFSRPAGAVTPTTAAIPTTRPATTAPPTTTPPIPAPARPTTTASSAPPAAVPPAAVTPTTTVAPQPAPTDTSLPPALALALEVTRGWQRAVR